MKKNTPIFLMVLVLVLASVACESPTPTPSAADVALTMISDQVNAQATQAKFESIAAVTQQIAAATATQQAVYVQATQLVQARVDAQATANKADANAQATSQQARQDAQATQQRMDFEATQVQARLDAEATSQQARLDLMATQQGSGTATAWAVTQAVIPLHDSWTQQAVQQEILLATNEVEMSNLKVKQQQDTNVFQWLVPMLFAIGTAIAGALWLANNSRVREVKDAEGTPQFVIIDNQKMIIPRLMPKPVLMLEDNGAPDLVDPKEQAEIVKRDQGIQALEVMPERTTDSAQEMYGGLFLEEQKKLPTIEFVTPDKIAAGVLDDIEGQVIEE